MPPSAETIYQIVAANSGARQIKLRLIDKAGTSDAAALLAIYVVRQVTRRQVERHRRVQDAPRPMPAPLVTTAPPA